MRSNPTIRFFSSRTAMMDERPAADGEDSAHLSTSDDAKPIPMTISLQPSSPNSCCDGLSSCCEDEHAFCLADDYMTSTTTTSGAFTTVPDLDKLSSRLVALLRDERWTRVERLLEDYPQLAKRAIPMICQGENAQGLPLHYACGLKACPVSTIDALVTWAGKASHLQPETSGRRLPLHVAIFKGASLDVIQYLVAAMPDALAVEDQEGNLPLHYACMYSCDAVVQLLLGASPEACQRANQRDRMPLHLLCARCWDTDQVTLKAETVQQVVNAYPNALQRADRRGRMPLHICCASHPRFDVLDVLVRAHGAALLAPDQSKRTPLQLAKKFGYPRTDDPTNVVTAYLQESTNKERRKKYKFLAPLSKLSSSMMLRRKPVDSDAAQLYSCYG